MHTLSKLQNFLGSFYCIGEIFKVSAQNVPLKISTSLRQEFALVALVLAETLVSDIVVCLSFFAVCDTLKKTPNKCPKLFFAVCDTL